MPDPYAIGAAVPALAATAAATPDAPAIVEDGKTTSFADLIAATARVAAAIADCPDGAVGILLPTGAGYVAAVFGCLAAGRLSVLLDAGYPAARNTRIAALARISVVLTSDALAATIDWPSVVVLITDALPEAGPLRDGGLGLDTPAFVLCTSGSTGDPKLLVHSQATMLHWARTTHNALHVTPADRALSLSSMSSLGGFTALLSYPLAGAAMAVLDVGTRGIGALLAVLGTGEVTILRAAPSLLRGLVKLPEAAAAMAGLRIVQSYGEPLFKADVAALRRVLAPDCLIRTTYGSTEASGLSWFAAEDDTHDPLRVPTGTLMPDTEALIDDGSGGTCARGVPGELVIRSRYNALGELVDGRLVPGRLLDDPVDPRLRIYRTGDIARCDPDGVFVILGRADRMLNVNGVRVEPTEIERALTGLPGVERAEVVALTRGYGASLAGFVVAEAGIVLDLMALKAGLRTLLPATMVPGRLFELPAMPLLPGGKVDTQALLALAAT